MTVDDWFIGIVCAVAVAPLPSLAGAVSSSLRRSIPRWIVQIASLAMPPGQRDDLLQEWLAELAIISTNPDLNAWRQSRAGCEYAFSLLGRSVRLRRATEHAGQVATKCASGKTPWPSKIITTATLLCVRWELRKATPLERGIAVLAIYTLASMATLKEGSSQELPAD